MKFCYLSNNRNIFISRRLIKIMVYKSINLAEFFSKYKHFLGYTSLQRSLITVVHELLTNALDACEESNILPDIELRVEQISNDTYRVVCRDNAAGIIKEEVPNIFGVLLYTSKFFEKKQTRGQQGIGVSGSILYAQSTTGEPAKVITKRKGDDRAYLFIIRINIKKNKPEVLEKKKIEWDQEHGTEVELIVKGRMTERLNEYIRRTALVHPYARIKYNGKVYERKTNSFTTPVALPVFPSDLDFTEFRDFLLSESNYSTIASKIYHSFKGIGWIRSKEAEKIVGKRYIEDLTEEDIKKIYLYFKELKPKISRDLVEKSVCLFGKETVEYYLKQFNPEKIFYASSKPEIWKSDVYAVEVGVAYNTAINDVHRFANKIPLMYQQGACVMTKVINEMNWKQYKFRRNAVFLVHVVSTSVPYTAQSKEAVADVEIIRQKIKSCLQSIGRQIRSYETYKENEERILRIRKLKDEIKEVLKDV